MSSIRVNQITDAAGGNSAVLNGVVNAPGGMNFRNRLINSDFRIDQRNNGAAVTPTNGAYTLDRWSGNVTQASKFTVQQNAGAVTPPAGFTNYLGVTSSSAYSALSGDAFTVYQAIEGFNVADLGWGTAAASSITLSFWVRSSLTGTFGGSIRNSTANRSYPFTYTVSAANTWEQKAVTIAGDTTGTWLTTNGIGLLLGFSLGTGSTFSGAAGAWSGSNLISATGATSVVGTSGATWAVTGVQLEAGTVATPFERVDFGTQLMRCQRYYEVTYADNAGEAMLSWPFTGTVSNSRHRWWFKQNKRALPTVTAPLGWTNSTPTINPGLDGVGFYSPNFFYMAGGANVVALTASAEL